MKNILFKTLALFFVIQLGNAQIPNDLKSKAIQASKALQTPETTPADPVSINSKIVWSNDKSHLAIILKASIEEQWHIYAYVPQNQPYIASRLELELPEGITAIGDWEKSISEPYGDDIFVYHGNPVFVQYCSVGSYNKSTTITSGLFYQTCDLRVCLPPQTKTKSLTL
ncbi:hypothetical protein GCM10022291_14430 [Postechiella marina]|uniref:Thiol:disulfide interchange protein DsbD N-terminal domain-containing protein n=1 Tax=Postechiella marina TaxID=943941 RepID=A0ABP8C6K7_9FLAO